jgi:hypothetical protein
MKAPFIFHHVRDYLAAPFHGGPQVLGMFFSSYTFAWVASCCYTKSRSHLDHNSAGRTVNPLREQVLYRIMDRNYLTYTQSLSQDRVSC